MKYLYTLLAFVSVTLYAQPPGGGNPFGPINRGGGGSGTNVISSANFNANQFTVNGTVASIKNGSLQTNNTFYGVVDATGVSDFNVGAFNSQGVFTLSGDLTFDSLSPNSILRINSLGNADVVTIGSGLSFDGTTLSASGGSQTPWTSDINGAGFSLIGVGSVNVTTGILAQAITLSPGFNFVPVQITSGGTNNMASLVSDSGTTLITSNGSIQMVNGTFRFGTIAAGATTLSNSSNGLNIRGTGTAAGSGLTVATNGNVGIGTATPTVALDVTGQITASTALRAGNTILSSSSLQGNNNNLTIDPGGTKFVLVPSANSVGIGTTTPTERLSVQGNATVATNLFVTNNIQSGGGSLQVYSASGQSLYLGNNPSIFGGSFRVQDGIGVTVPSGNMYRFSANTTSFGAQDTALYRESAGTVGTTNFHVLNKISTVSTNSPIAFTTTGYTNGTGGNVFVSIIGTALTVTKKETNGATLFAYGTITGALPAIPLKPNQWLETSGTLSSNNVEPW